MLIIACFFLGILCAQIMQKKIEKERYLYFNMFSSAFSRIVGNVQYFNKNIVTSNNSITNYNEYLRNIFQFIYCQLKKIAI